MIGLKTRIASALAVVATLGAGVAVPSVAQSYQAQVDTLFRIISNTAAQNGYGTSHNRHDGALRTGESERVTIDLNGGVSYMIVGACDTDCSDIDLWLYDENGNLIDSDTEYDDTPIVLVTPRRSARFTIQSRMITCTVQPCFYGVGAYAR